MEASGEAVPEAPQRAWSLRSHPIDSPMRAAFELLSCAAAADHLCKACTGSFHVTPAQENTSTFPHTRLRHRRTFNKSPWMSWGFTLHNKSICTYYVNFLCIAPLGEANRAFASELLEVWAEPVTCCSLLTGNDPHTDTAMQLWRFTHSRYISTHAVFSHFKAGISHKNNGLHAYIRKTSPTWQTTNPVAVQVKASFKGFWGWIQSEVSQDPDWCFLPRSGFQNRLPTRISTAQAVTSFRAPPKLLL